MGEFVVAFPSHIVRMPLRPVLVYLSALVPDCRVVLVCSLTGPILSDGTCGRHTTRASTLSVV